MQEKLLITGSVIFFTAGFAYFLVGLLLGRNERKKWKVSPFLGLAIGTAIAIWLLYLNGNRDASSGWLEQLMMSILGTIRTVTGENSVWDTRDQVFELAPEIEPLFSFYTATLHISTSSVVIGAILKIVDVFFPMLRYMLFSRKYLYVFSSLTERGILLAEDIQKNNKKATFVFLNNENGANTELLSKRAHEMSAYVFAYETKELWKPFRVKTQNIEYFLLKDNHDENVDEALSLAEKYEDEKYKDKEARVHILSDSQETVNLLDIASQKSHCILRLINEAKLTVYNLLDTKPLFLTPKKQSDILIVGAGKNGQAAIKACSWCGYTQERTPNIYVIDKEIAPKQKLEKDAPEMMAEGNIHYEVIDVESPAFLEFLRLHLLEADEKIGYVFCTLGDDHLNLRTAMDVRSVSYEGEPFDAKEDKLPYINVLLEDTFLAKTASELTFKVGENAGGRRSYELVPYGGIQEFYTWENICASKLEGAGLAVNFHYEVIQDKKIKGNKIEDNERGKYYDGNYQKSNYNRDSSIASGLHAKYRLYALLEKCGSLEYMTPVDWKKIPDEATLQKLDEFLKNNNNANVIEELAKLEHRRWNAYMYSEGWKTAEGTNRKLWGADDNLANHRNFGAKYHACLVDWEALKSLNVTKDEKVEEDGEVVTKKVLEDFQEYDRVLVRETCDVLKNTEYYRKKLLQNSKDKK